MIADTLLRLLGANPIAYPDPEDKWIVIGVRAAFVAVPIILIILFLAPFLYLWFKKKRFTLRNVLISLLVGAVLLALGVGGVYVTILILHGLAVQDIYGDSPYF